MSDLVQPLKWHGGKGYLASRIVALMPKHLHFVEPYAGGLAVLLAKEPEGVSEVVNDLDYALTTFWRVLQDERMFAQLQRKLEATPFSEQEFKWSYFVTDIAPTDPTHSEGDWPAIAAAFFVQVRQSLAGRQKAFAPLSRTRVRRGMNEQASAWLTAIEGLPAVHARLKRVVILNRDALEVIKGQDGPSTLFYCDPPYLHSTRATTSEYGALEMSEAQHVELLEVLNAVQGKVMLSGYRSELHDARLKSWNRHDFDLPNNAAGGESKRRMTECLWLNY